MFIIHFARHFHPIQHDHDGRGSHPGHVRSTNATQLPRSESVVQTKKEERETSKTKQGYGVYYEYCSRERESERERESIIRTVVWAGSRCYNRTPPRTRKRRRRRGRPQRTPPLEETTAPPEYYDGRASSLPVYRQEEGHDETRRD